METKTSIFSALAIAASLSAASLSAASAATVSFESTLNLNAPGVFTPGFINSWGSGDGFSPVIPHSVAVGDTVNITFNFGGTGVSAIVYNAIAAMWDWNPIAGGTADGGPYASVNMTGSISLLGQSGNPVYTSNILQSDECCVHIGQYFSTTTLGPISFYGVRYTGVLNSATPSNDRTYNLPGLQLFTIDERLIAAVPEPTTWAMLLLGFAGIGIVSYRRNRQQRSLATSAI